MHSQSPIASANCPKVTSVDGVEDAATGATASCQEFTARHVVNVHRGHARRAVANADDASGTHRHLHHEPDGADAEPPAAPRGCGY